MSMDTQSNEMTILFADVSGSVALHERLGDQEAHRVIVYCLRTMSQAVDRCNGKVVEIIGDEIMSLFHSAEEAFHAAQAIQMDLNSDEAPGIRVGFHTGSAAFDKGHPFGDTVNVAARLASLARAGQIVISSDSQQRLTEESRAETRFFDRIQIKGKATPFELYEVLWGDHEVQTTFISPATSIPRAHEQHASELTLNFSGTDYHLTERDLEISIGRTPDCRIQVHSVTVSRSHLTIKFQRGKILLQDHSTNGTYVRISPETGESAGQDIYLHRDEWLMSGSGLLGLGEPIVQNNPFLVHFRCR